jgi:polysaccharide biosynthesis protein PslH
MRILWLNANLLLPLDKGGKLRTWHLMRHLARRHEIAYLSFADPDERDAHASAMAEVCAHLVTVPRREPDRDSARFYAGVIKHLVSAAPYAVAKYRSGDYRQAFDRLVSTRCFDRIVCDFLVPAVNLPLALPCPSVLFTHNVEAEIWRRHAETAAPALRRVLYEQQWKRMQRFEGETLGRFDHILAVSEVDRATFHRLYPVSEAIPISVVPTGVDTAYFAPASASAPDAPPHLVFVGSMDWLPNEDAMIYFCHDILPRIAAAVPDVTLGIVGREPSTRVRRLARDGAVEVTGRVADVRPALQAATVVIVPLRIGGGTRLKIFEAMAAGRAVVSTTVGAEGLEARPGRDLLVADGAEPFADAVISLLRDPARRQAIAHEGQQLVRERFDWSAVSGALERAVVRTAFLPREAARAS